MAQVVRYEVLVEKMPKGVVELVECWVRKLWHGETRNSHGEDLTQVYIGRIKGALEAMEEMDYITDDERWALYRFYRISKSTNKNPAVIVYER